MAHPDPAETSSTNNLYLFAFGEDESNRLDCPDCAAFCAPVNLGEAVDWALGHKCANPREPEEPGRG